MWIYDRDGVAALLLSASGRLFTPRAVQVGWLEDGAVFTLQARQVAWFSGGLLRDVQGSVAGFSPGAADAVRPALPSPSAPSGVLSLPAATARPACVDRVQRPTDRPVWSALRPLELFPPDLPS